MNINCGKLIRTVGAFTLSKLPLMVGEHPRHRTEGTSHGEFALLTFLPLIAHTFSDVFRIFVSLIRKMPLPAVRRTDHVSRFFFRFARERLFGERGLEEFL